MNNTQKGIEEFESFNFQKILEFVSNYWKHVVISLLVFIASAYVYVRYTTSQYRSTAKILIKNDSEKNGLGNFQLDGLGLIGQSFGAESEVEILKSRQLIGRVVEKLNLSTSVYAYGGLTKIKKTELFSTDSPFWIDYIHSETPDFEPIEMEVRYAENKFTVDFNNGKYLTLRSGDFFLVNGVNLKIYLNDQPAIQENQKFDVIISPKDRVITALRKQIKIDNEQISEGIIGISLDGLSSLKNNAILNELIAQHQQHTIEEKNNIALKTNKFLESRLKSIENKLDSIEDLGRQIRSSNGIIDVSTEFPAILIEERQLEEELFELSVNEALAQQLIEFLRSDEDYQSLIPVNIGFQSTTLSSSISNYNQLVLERNNLLSGSSESNPLVVKRLNDIIRLRANLKKSIESYQSSVADQKKRVLSKLSEFTSKKTAIPKYELDYKDIMRDQQIRESIYLLLLQKKEENEIILASTESNIRIIDLAYSDPKPVAPNKKVVFILAAILGTALPISFFYLKGLLNNKVKGIEDIERYGLPLIGEVPTYKGDIQDLIHQTNRNPIAEAFIGIRTNISFILNQTSKSVVLITSTIAGEGKTFVTLNLARSLANSGKKVVVVGLDLRAPKLLEYIDLPYTVGVSDYISNERYAVDNITYHHDLIEGVDFIPCGTIPPNPSELLLRERFTNLMNELKATYDIVLVDTSPVGLVADTLSIAHIADLLIYVARSGKLKSDLLEIPQKLHTENKFKSMSVLLNGSEMRDIGYGYGYGYTGESKKSLFRKLLRLKRK